MPLLAGAPLAQSQPVVSERPCPFHLTDPQVELKDYDVLSSNDMLVDATWADWAAFPMEQTKRLHDDDDPNSDYYGTLAHVAPSDGLPRWRVANRVSDSSRKERPVRHSLARHAAAPP